MVTSQKTLNHQMEFEMENCPQKRKVEDTKNRNNRGKKERTIKAVVGFSMEEIKKIRDANQDDRGSDALRYKYVQEIKDKKKKYLEKNRKAKGVQASTQGKAIKSQPKNTGKGARK